MSVSPLPTKGDPDPVGFGPYYLPRESPYALLRLADMPRLALPEDPEKLRTDSANWHDGEWRDRINLAHEAVTHDGHEVPLFAPRSSEQNRNRTVWGWPWHKAFKRKGSR